MKRIQAKDFSSLDMAPPPPPLSVSKAPEPRRHAAVEKTSPSETPAVVESEPVPVEKPELTAPVNVPKDIAQNR